MLAGCAGTAATDGGADVPRGPIAAAADRGAASESTATGAASADPALTRQTARTASPSGPAAPKVDSDPNQLLGLAPAKVADLLGKPGFVRRDGPAQVWQYRAASCILDVFLYRTNGGLEVTYLEIRGRGAARQSRRECFAEMLAGGDAHRTG